MTRRIVNLVKRKPKSKRATVQASADQQTLPNLTAPHTSPLLGGLSPNVHQLPISPSESLL
jgi:hypothetical protein